MTLGSNERIHKTENSWTVFWARLVSFSQLDLISDTRINLRKPRNGLKFTKDQNTDPSVSLTLGCFMVYSTRQFVLSLALCYFVLAFFSPFNIAITSLGEEKANLNSFRTFVRFVLILSVSSSTWCLGRVAAWDCGTPWTFLLPFFYINKKGKRKVQGVPQSQTAALPRPQEEEETDKSKQAQSSCGHGTKAVIQNHKSINEWRIRMFRPTDMDPRTKGVIRCVRV